MKQSWPYRSNGKLSPWLKIKNPMYSQAELKQDVSSGFRWMMSGPLSKIMEDLMIDQ
jgi:hypothetical protein